MQDAPRIYAAKFSAKMLLKKIWLNADSDDARQVLIDAPKQASSLFGITTTFAPSILGEEKIAGLFDRLAKQIVISTRFPSVSQRFTFAHELGHMMLHPGQVYFRDMEISEPSFGGNRPYYEIEADAFAAELLMPQKYLEQAFLQKFGAPINGTRPNLELAEGVSIRRAINGRSIKIWTPSELAKALPIDRARAIAASSTYNARSFLSLARHFEVSVTAMGIQLLRAGLVS